MNNNSTDNQTIKIFIVEDEQVTALDLKTILFNAGYNVEEPFSSGEEALNCIDKKKPDLIIMDIDLAGEIDGIDTAKKIKQKYDIPIIYLTAYSNKKILNRAKKTEPHGFIIKPYKRNNILPTVEIVLYKFKYDKKLIISEKKFHDLFQNMIEGFAYCKVHYNKKREPVDFIFQDTNIAFEKIIGINRRDIFGRKVSEIYKDNDAELVEILKRVALSNGGIFSKYYSTFLNKWLSIKAYSPRAGFVAIIFNDITFRINLEREKNRVLTELDQIFNTTVIGICLIDINYNIIRVNDIFLSFYNLGSEDVIGEKCYGALKDPECKTGMCPLKRIIERSENVEYEIELKACDNTVKKYLITAAPFYTHNGEIFGILKTYTDITEVRRLENDIMNISEVERQNIGQDLHDGLGQKLTGVAFLCEALKQRMFEKGYPEITDIIEIIDIVGDSIEHTRQIAKGLCPINFEAFGIDSALEELAIETERLFNIDCKLEIIGGIDFKDNSITRNLYYIANESVNNAIKHGKAEWIKLILYENDNNLLMRVENNITVKFMPDTNNSGMGLRIMRYRADIIGAEFEYEKNNSIFAVNVRLKNINIREAAEKKI